MNKYAEVFGRELEVLSKLKKTDITLEHLEALAEGRTSLVPHPKGE